MKDINLKLKPNFSLPNIKSTEQIDFLEIFPAINDTFLTVSINLPVINKIGIETSEFIPIPMREDKTLYILDMKTTKYYVQDMKVHLLPNDTFNSLCKSTTSTIICNNFLENYTEEPSVCFSNLILHNTDTECIYKQIEYKNYFIKTSETSIFVYIVDPIKIIKNCRGKNKILDLTYSHHMLLPPGCTIYKYIEKAQLINGKTTISDMRKQNINLKIDLSNFESNEILSTIPLWDKYDIQFIKTKLKIKRLKKEIPLLKQKIQNIQPYNSTSNLLPTFTFKEILNNKITIFIISSFVILLSLLVMKSMIIKLITKWND